MNPPVPGVEASTKLSGDTHRGVAGRLHDLPQRHAVVGEPLRIHLYL